MSQLRLLKAASIRLGIEFQKRYEALNLATGEDEVTQAAIALGQLFNDNVEFIIWSLKKTGGHHNLPSPEQIRSPVAQRLNSDG